MPPKNTEIAKLPAYTVEKVDEETGEVRNVPEFKYVEGNPREYKSDAKDGNFLLSGKSIGEELTFQPIAWRFFEEDLFNLGMRSWAEIFFVDSRNCVSAILFHGFSVDALKEMASPLYYDDLSLADVVITARWTHLQNTKVAGKPTFCVASFEYEQGEEERTKYLKGYAKTVKIYRKTTSKETTNNNPAFNYHNPFLDNAALIEA